MLPLLLPLFLPHVPLHSAGGELLWVESFWKFLGVAVPTYWRREENPRRELFLRAQETAYPYWLPTAAMRHTWEHKTCLLPTVCTIWEICSCQNKKWGQAQENGSCDLWMHTQLLGLKVPCPQQLWAKASKAETGEAQKQLASVWPTFQGV